VEVVVVMDEEELVKVQEIRKKTREGGAGGGGGVRLWSEFQGSGFFLIAQTLQTNCEYLSRLFGCFSHFPFSLQVPAQQCVQERVPEVPEERVPEN
jgi:hypothetical protein